MKMPGLFEGRMCQKCLPDDNYAQLQSFVQQRLAGQERSVCLATAKDPHVAFTDWSGCLVPPKQNQQKKKERAIVWLHRGKCYSLIDEQPNVAKASRDTSAAVFAKARGPAEAHTTTPPFNSKTWLTAQARHMTPQWIFIRLLLWLVLSFVRIVSLKSQTKENGADQTQIPWGRSCGISGWHFLF